MYRANLSYKLLIVYLEEMITADLVLLTDDEQYILTEKGKNAIKMFTRVPSELA
jgi:predicted transcriptional regulator